MNNSLVDNNHLVGDILAPLLPSLLGEENTSLDITPSDGAFSDPFSNDTESLSNIEKALKSEQESNNTVPNNFSVPDVGIDPFTGSNIDTPSNSVPASAIEGLDLSDTSFAPPKSQLELIGGFGDFEGGNDVTLEIKNTDGEVVETFALSGAGQGEVYRDEENAYLFFSGTDETTNVDISSVSNIRFGDYYGDSLDIETTGSIDGGNVVLSDESGSETGLALKSGLEGGAILDYEFNGYDLVDFGDVEVIDLNYFGNVVGSLIDYDGREKAFFYNGAGFYTLGGLYTSRAYAINDRGDIVIQGQGSVSDASQGFIAPNGGAITPLSIIAEGGARGFGFIRDINNSGSVAAYLLSLYPTPATPDTISAYYLSTTEVVNIGNLLNSQDTRAFGINDLGQVVGSNKDTGIGFVHGDGVLISIGTLPGDVGSRAYAINNQGQIVGTSYGQNGERAFLYSDGVMEDIGVSYVGSLNERYGIDINNLGQVVVGSYVYEDGELTNINNLLNPQYVPEGLSITRAKGINDRGQIIAQGIYEGENHGYLLNPTFLPIFQDNYINIGNISTYGDSVLLDGGEITLEGETVNTNGGSITFNGETLVNNSLLTIDSSVVDNNTLGGDISFNGALDGVGAGSQNLTIKAGTGNLIFEDAVGGNAAFLDFSVEGAGTIAANGDITVEGNLSLEAIDDITTTNLTTGGLTNISLGQVGEEIFASTGNVTTGNIEALGLEVLNNGNFEAGNIATSDGDINIISLNNLTVGELTATNGAIDLISGTASINVSGAIQGDNGFIALAPQDIVTNEITSSKDVVILKSNQGAVTVNGAITAYDDVSLAAANNLTVGAVTSQDGGIALISATGNIALSGAISSMVDITVASAQSLTIDQEIKAELGSIALGSTGGSVTVSVAIDNAIGVNIAAKENVSTKKIRTFGDDVIVQAQQGTAIIGGAIRSKGGNVFISALEKVRTKNIISKGGDVSVVSDTRRVKTGYIRTDSKNSNGDVYLEASRNIKVGAFKEIDGTNYSIYAGEDGKINIANQLNKKETKRNIFTVGDITGSGTLALISSPPVVSPTPVTPVPGGGTVSPNPILIYIEVFRRVLDAGDAAAPTVADVINPVTGKPYRDDAERRIVEQLTPDQEREIRRWVTSQNGERAFLDDEDVFNDSEIDDNGCFTSELNIHLGDLIDPSAGGLLDVTHSRYAEQITGADGDYFVVTPDEGIAALFDGLVNEDGQIVELGFEDVGSVAEVKTGLHLFLRKATMPGVPGYIGSGISDLDRSDFFKFERQLLREYNVATVCNMNYFMSFTNEFAAEAVRYLYGDLVTVYNIPIQV